MANLYVFVDESGNYDFSPRGTKYWVLASFITTDVCLGLVDLHELKHRVIDSGIDIEMFHASEDRQSVRDMVFSVISKLEGARADAVVVEKRKAAPSIRDLNRFYPLMVENLLKYALNQRDVIASNFEKVFVFLDRAATRKREKEVLKKGVKEYLARHLGDVPYVICMHSSASHYCLQVVDYVCWSVYVKWERGETRPFDRVRHLLKSEFPIFRFGSVNWY